MAFVYATPEKVALGWAASIFNTAMVGEQLPADNTTWAASGFITPTISPGLGPHIYYRLGRPVASFQCWAVKPDTGVPPWGRAQNIAQTLAIVGGYRNEPVSITVPDASENARVLSAYAINDPRKVFGDLGDYAAYVVDIQLWWVATPKP